MRGTRDDLLTLAVGVVFGFIAASLAAPLLSESVVIGAPTESAKVHDFLMSRVDDPSSLLSSSTGTEDIATRAFKLGIPSEAKPRVLSVTYLGTSSQGPLQVHEYVVEYQIQSETGAVPWTLTVLNSPFTVLKVE